MPRHNEMQMTPLALSTFGFSDGILSAFASDFNGFRTQQIWNDACDIGIAIYSEKTGTTERFYLEREEVREGDLMAWYFKPCNKKLTTVKSVVIFND